MWLLDHLAKDWVLPAAWLILGNTSIKPGNFISHLPKLYEIE